MSTHVRSSIYKIVFQNEYGSVHDNLVVITYAQRPLINAHADVSSRARNLNLSLSLHLHPYFEYASSQGSDEHMHRLAWAFVAPLVATITKISCADPYSLSKGLFHAGDKNSTRPLITTSDIQKGQVILAKALILQDERFGKNYSWKSHYILLPYVLYCRRF